MGWFCRGFLGFLCLGFSGVFSPSPLFPVLVSFLCSENKLNALWGDFDWDMGLFSQLVFVGAYFLASRGLSDRTFVKGIAFKRLLIYGALITYTAVCVLELVQRLGFDPFGWYADFGFYDWNRRNLLSTIGNINWLWGI